MFRQLLTRHKWRSAAPLLAVLSAAMIAAPASAESCKAPPGMSAIDQYCEAIPSPSGDRGSSDSDRGGQPIPAAARRALARQGADGAAIVHLSAPASRGEKATRGGGTQAAPIPAKVRPESPSGNPLSAVADGLGAAGDTSGPLFGTVLLFLALVFFATAWLRYRRRAQS
jgi:hypothetical protein